MLGSVGASVVVLGGVQPASIGGPGVCVAGVLFSGGDSVGKLGKGNRQLVMPATKLNSKKKINTFFIKAFLRLKVHEF
jgi:hypothetical protein